MAEARPQVTVSAFESSFFGGPVWRYTPDGAFAPAECAAAAASEDVRLVSCRIPSESDRALVSAIEQAGFRRIEELVTLRRPVEPAPKALRDVAPAREGDGEACVAIAVAAFRQDRYHADPRIPDEVADAIKAAWVRNDIAGRADLSLVARTPDRSLAGFNLLVRDGDEAVIDLIAVSPATWKSGYGKALVAAGLQAYAGSVETMRVGTQASNTVSLALYQSLGFRIVDRQLTYHLVPDGASPNT